MQDQHQYLTQAIDLAREAGDRGNHPCGAVVVSNTDNQVITSHGNQTFSIPDITAHAEMLCLREASKPLMAKPELGMYTMYCSCEPCAGCSFYIARTRINKIVYASKDRFRPGISLLKADHKFDIYFDNIEIVEEPLADLRDEALILMRDRFLARSRPDIAKFFEPLDS